MSYGMSPQVIFPTKQFSTMNTIVRFIWFVELNSSELQNCWLGLPSWSECSRVICWRFYKSSWAGVLDILEVLDHAPLNLTSSIPSSDIFTAGLKKFIVLKWWLNALESFVGNFTSLHGRGCLIYSRYLTARHPIQRVHFLHLTFSLLVWKNSQFEMLVD